MPLPTVALQMYTVRELTAQDYPGTLKRVAEIGYKAVQVTRPDPNSAGDIRKVMDDLGLESAGTHIGLNVIQDNFQLAVDTTKALGTEWLVIPSIPKELREDAAKLKDTGRVFNELGAKLKEQGLKLAYHNHAFEFETYEGTTGYDLMFEQADPELVQNEIDTYWVQFGGEDPVGMLKRFSGRIEIVHFKDMGEGEDKPMVPVGEGILDWPAILDACQEGGTRYVCIEQDRTEPLEPLEAARISLENCRKWGLT